MTTIKSVTNGNYTHVLSYTLVSQSISANTSSITYKYTITWNGSGTAAYQGGTNPFKATINGVGDTENHGFNFASQSEYTMVSGSATITHNSDGTKSFSASFDGPVGGFSTGFAETTGSGTVTLPTIPRASTPTFKNSAGTAITEFVVDGSSVLTIDTNRADSSFTHTVSYTFGSASGTIATGVGASTTWTPPTSLLSQIPSSMNGNVTITTITYSGTTVVGTTNVSFQLDVPTSAIPTISGLTATEATTTPNVASLIGQFVQNISTLAVALSGDVGVYGSTIASASITVGDSTMANFQVIAGASGTTTAFGQAGSSVPIKATVTDSRGQSGTLTINVVVLAYTVPSITTATFSRALVSGTLDPNGTYISIGLAASVHSLLNGSTEKNDLSYSFKKRLRGSTTAWSSITPDIGPVDAHALTVATTLLPGTYSVANAYDVRLEITDAMANTTAVQGTLSTGGVTLHFPPAADAIAVGKYWAQGSIDAQSQIYQNNGNAVLDVTSTLTSAMIAAILASYTLPGEIKPWLALGTPPAGWLEMGTTGNSRTAYPALWATVHNVNNTCTITTASPAVITTPAAHGLSIADQVFFTTTGTLPTGLSLNQSYWVLTTPSTTTMTISTTRLGAAVAVTAAGSGTHTLNRTLLPFTSATTFDLPSMADAVLAGYDEASGLQLGGINTPTHSHPLSGNGGTPFALASSTMDVNRNGPTVSGLASGNHGTNVTWGGGSGSITSSLGLVGNTDAAASSMPKNLPVRFLIKT